MNLAIRQDDVTQQLFVDPAFLDGARDDGTKLFIDPDKSAGAGRVSGESLLIKADLYSHHVPSSSTHSLLRSRIVGKIRNLRSSSSLYMEHIEFFRILLAVVSSSVSSVPKTFYKTFFKGSTSLSTALKSLIRVRTLQVTSTSLRELFKGLSEEVTATSTSLSVLNYPKTIRETLAVTSSWFIDDQRYIWKVLPSFSGSDTQISRSKNILEWLTVSTRSSPRVNTTQPIRILVSSAHSTLHEYTRVAFVLLSAVSSHLTGGNKVFMRTFPVSSSHNVERVRVIDKLIGAFSSSRTLAYVNGTVYLVLEVLSGSEGSRVRDFAITIGARSSNLIASFKRLPRGVLYLVKKIGV